MTYSNLTIWQKAMDLVEKIYLLSNNLPSSEKFGLASQIQRAAVSIPSNIAEGYTRASTKEFLHFLYIAKGSNSELFTQILICERIGFLSSEETRECKFLSEEISKLLSATIVKLQNK